MRKATNELPRCCFWRCKRRCFVSLFLSVWWVFSVVLLVERCGNSKIKMFVYAGNVKIKRFATDKIVSEKSKTAEWWYFYCNRCGDCLYYAFRYMERWGMESAVLLTVSCMAVSCSRIPLLRLFMVCFYSLSFLIFVLLAFGDGKMRLVPLWVADGCLALIVVSCVLVLRERKRIWV